MQSQQKRVKWSRGETAEALEERTDTGITLASVELMENCIPDIYGNVSRRPGLKVFENGAPSYQVEWFSYDEYLQVIPFYITENDYILIGVHFNGKPEFIRIKDGVAVWEEYGNRNPIITKYPITSVMIDGTRAYKPVSYSQQNNYMLIADGYNVYKVQMIFYPSSLSSPYDFVPTIEIWKFSAGWYAPNGTQTKSVSTAGTANISFHGDSVCSYVYTDKSVGISTSFSAIYTGIGTNYSQLEDIQNEIPLGSIVKMPEIGCSMRVEGFFAYLMPFEDTTFDGVLNSNDTVPATGTYCRCPSAQGNVLYKIVDGNVTGTYSLNFPTNTVRIYVKNSDSSSGYSYTTYSGAITNKFTAWYKNATFPGTNSIWMYGSLLTPVADNQAIDETVTVEYGYESLQPTSWDTQSFPHPKKLVFNDQRLWAGAWAYSLSEEYALAIGSQIARYNDLKNDYNQGNEPITLDILTQYKERILHLVNYNGLKIMTDSFEYAYIDGGVVKQSANGSFEYCEPIVFDSLCLYVDGTGCQVKAMQYELQSNIFNSSTINQLAPKDLIWYPWSIGYYEDKINNTGKYLFLVNRKDSNTRLAVCNFVPENQANIWNRWSFPVINTNMPMIHSVVNLKSGAIFMVVLRRVANIGYDIPNTTRIVPACLDFNLNADIESSVITDNNINYFGISQPDGSMLSLPSFKINIYSNGVFQFSDTTTSTGALTKSISGLTNVTVGLPINATVRSHPIDVGGKTKSIKKRIAKTVLSVHGTEPSAITINGKTGYMNPQKDKINFYGVTGMKDEIKYTLTNNNGEMFHLESLLMNIEYGTLIS